MIYFHYDSTNTPTEHWTSHANIQLHIHCASALTLYDTAAIQSIYAWLNEMPNNVPITASIYLDVPAGHVVTNILTHAVCLWLADAVDTNTLRRWIQAHSWEYVFCHFPAEDPLSIYNWMNDRTVYSFAKIPHNVLAWFASLARYKNWRVQWAIEIKETLPEWFHPSDLPLCRIHSYQLHDNPVRVHFTIRKPAAVLTAITLDDPCSSDARCTLKLRDGVLLEGHSHGRLIVHVRDAGGDTTYLYRKKVDPRPYSADTPLECFADCMGRADRPIVFLQRISNSAVFAREDDGGMTFWFNIKGNLWNQWMTKTLDVVHPEVLLWNKCALVHRRKCVLYFWNATKYVLATQVLDRDGVFVFYMRSRKTQATFPVRLRYAAKATAVAANTDSDSDSESYNDHQILFDPETS